MIRLLKPTRLNRFLHRWFGVGNHYASTPGPRCSCCLCGQTIGYW
jgi:hypothetical protein